MSWQNGRQLAAAYYLVPDGYGGEYSVNFSYGYNESGIRTSKNLAGMEYVKYYLNGSSIVREEKTDPVGGMIHALDFFYDANGDLFGFEYANNKYYYVRNGQNDITGILDSSGAVVVSYEYDTWGKLLSVSGNTTLGNLNPFRYRGYYYDSETGLYYLNSRYYDPVTGRMINADAIVSGAGTSVQGYNLFTYCFNNPVNMDDPSGHWPKWIKNIAAVAKTVTKAIVKAVNVATKLEDAISQSFILDIGFGYGIGGSTKISGTKVDLEAYQDVVTFGIKNGVGFTSTKGGANITTGFGENKVGLGTTYEHYYERDGEYEGRCHDTFSAPWSIYMCEETEKETVLGTNIFGGDGKFGKDITLTWGGSAHAGIGGHFEIGLNLSEFIRIMGE